MNYTPEQLIKFEKYLGGHIIRDCQRIAFDLSDWRIIKALEAKMCEELDEWYREVFPPDDIDEVKDWMIEYHSSEKGNITGIGTDEKSAILNAVEQHINKEKKNG